MIIGGGDGVACLGYDKNPEGEFWDLSYKMTQLASENLKTSGLKTQTGAWPGKGKFDRIVLPFVLDTLSDPEIQILISQVKSAILPQGKVIFSDFFVPVSFGQKLIQKSMIAFFQTFTAHQRKDLPAITQYFKSEGFERIEEKNWRRGWIRSPLWKLNYRPDIEMVFRMSWSK